MEGISGCGKSSSINQLQEYVESLGHGVYVYEWNSNRWLRALIRWLGLKQTISASLYSLLQWCGFILDYFFIIIPRLWMGNIVLCDRYVYTGLVRDRANGAKPYLGRCISKFVRKPDLIFFIDQMPELCQKRIATRGKKLFHTNAALISRVKIRNKELFYLRRCRRIYLCLFHPSNPLTEGRVSTMNEGCLDMKIWMDTYIRDIMLVEH